MSQLFLNYTCISQGDSIGRLNLTNRPHNALTRSGIRTIGEVIQLIESGKIQTIRGLGRKGILEIENSIAHVEISDMSEVEANIRIISTQDSIGRLNLTNRPHNALTRSGIRTIGEVIQLIESGKIQTIRGLGRKGILEIENSIAHVEISEATEVKKTDLEEVLQIEQLNLTNHSLKALRRSGIGTVEEAARLIESGKIRTIFGLERKCVLEIKDRLTQIGMQDIGRVDPNAPRIPRKMNWETIPEPVIKWQSQLVTKQLSTKLLHKQAKIADRSVKDWLKIGIADTNTVYKILSSILGSSINICEEIEFLLNQISDQNYLVILLSRYGFERKTLQQIGREIGTSRERVRQIDNNVKGKLNDKIRAIFEAKSVNDIEDIPILLKIQSALLIARDMGLDINYEKWVQHIRSSGLVGNWKSQEFIGKDAVEVMIAICNLLDDCRIPCLQISKNLQYAVQLAVDGTPNVSVKILHALETLPNKIKRFINRHTKHSGGVHARWLSQEIERKLEDTKDILRGLEYRKVSKDWFIPKSLKNSNSISKQDVFHRGLRKMFWYCGPISIDDVCSGLRHILSRTKFPVPPPDVMDEIVRTYNYKCEDGLYYWDGIYDANLSASEVIIMDFLERIRPVAHHSELVRAFLDSELSVPALSLTLKHSPLFEKVETALYKVRGRLINYQDIERAKSSGERQFLNLEVEYDTEANVIVSFTVSAIIIGLGAVICERFPNLNGNDWDCYVRGKEVGKLSVTENEFQHLKKPFELLDCQPGNRLKFTFNMWKRTVIIEKVETNAK